MSGISNNFLFLVSPKVIMCLEKGNMNQMTRFIANYIAFSAHMLFNMLPSQEVIDHSTNVQNAV